MVQSRKQQVLAAKTYRDGLEHVSGKRRIAKVLTVSDSKRCLRHDLGCAECFVALTVQDSAQVPQKQLSDWADKARQARGATTRRALARACRAHCVRTLLLGQSATKPHTLHSRVAAASMSMHVCRRVRRTVLRRKATELRSSESR